MAYPILENNLVTHKTRFGKYAKNIQLSFSGEWFIKQTMEEAADNIFSRMHLTKDWRIKLELSSLPLMIITTFFSVKNFVFLLARLPIYKKG